jgi:hypothetical protein
MPNTDGQDPKRAILYARVSTDEQKRGAATLWLNSSKPCTSTPPGRAGTPRSCAATCFPDLYKPHTFEEVRELVSPEVVATLDLGKHYGVGWGGRG